MDTHVTLVPPISDADRDRARLAARESAISRAASTLRNLAYGGLWPASHNTMRSINKNAHDLAQALIVVGNESGDPSGLRAIVEGLRGAHPDILDPRAENDVVLEIHNRLEGINEMRGTSVRSLSAFGEAIRKLSILNGEYPRVVMILACLEVLTEQNWVNPHQTA